MVASNANYRVYCFKATKVFTNITGYFHDLRHIQFRKENPKSILGNSDVE